MSAVMSASSGLWGGLRRYGRTWLGLVLATIMLDLAMTVSYRISPSDATRSLSQSFSVLTTNWLLWAVSAPLILLLVRMLATQQAPPAPPGPESPSYLTRVVLKSTGKIAFVDVADIDWIAAEGDYLNLHTCKGSHLLRSTMTMLEQQLDPREFVRIHRSTMVRLNRVKEMQPYFRGEYIVILHDGTRLKLSRGYREQLQAAVGQVL